MTATAIIRQIQALPAREKRKVFRFVYDSETPNLITRRALQEDVSRSPRYANPEGLLKDLRR